MSLGAQENQAPTSDSTATPERWCLFERRPHTIVAEGRQLVLHLMDVIVPLDLQPKCIALPLVGGRELLHDQTEEVYLPLSIRSAKSCAVSNLLCLQLAVVSASWTWRGIFENIFSNTTIENRSPNGHQGGAKSPPPA